jgi:hypothetical protein
MNEMNGKEYGWAIESANGAIFLGLINDTPEKVKRDFIKAFYVDDWEDAQRHYQVECVKVVIEKVE